MTILIRIDLSSVGIVGHTFNHGCITLHFLEIDRRW